MAITPEEIKNTNEFVNRTVDLCKELTTMATGEDVDPAQLIRLTAIGVSHGLVGIAMILQQRY